MTPHAATFPALLEAFFTDRLVRQRQASPHTIASCRDTFRLLLRYAAEHLDEEPSALTLSELDVPLVSGFLDHLEHVRGNGARTRNVRLAAIHSFLRYVALSEPAYVGVVQRVLALPTKRWDRTEIEFLTRPEIDALLAAPDLGSWSGRRDRAMILVAVQTGLRVSELTGLRAEDVSLGRAPHVLCRGKGRKERTTPLRRETATVLRDWLREQRSGPTDPLFPSARGLRLSTDGVAYVLAKHVREAARTCASLRTKRVTPHVLRHSAAMDLLHHGVDRSVIALWLGHESVETTEIYLHADLATKRRALARTAPLDAPPGRYRPGDELLAFLGSL